MGNERNHNCIEASKASDVIRHVYVHIPFCARICPYCAFYKELLDRSQLHRFCEAILCEIREHQGATASKPSAELKRRSGERRSLDLLPSTIYFGGGTPTALSTSQLQLLLEDFHAQLDLSALTEWTIEANPGSVSARKAALLRELGVNRISLGVQSWDDDLLKILGREHNSNQAEQSFAILRNAGSTNINIDLMFGLPGQAVEQWRTTLEKTIALGPEHISAYCLTYEEDTEFFLRHARGEFRQDSDTDAELFEMTMSILEAAGYEQYEISNYARPGFESAHNRAYWTGTNYLGIGPSAFSTIGMQRWQNVANYRDYSDRVLRGDPAVNEVEQLTPKIKRTEKIALSLRTREGIAARDVRRFPQQTREFIELGLLQQSNGNLVLTKRGKSLADSVAEAFVDYSTAP
jgi:oxygen-independent coproporphyrinogen-3 oxidase